MTGHLNGSGGQLVALAGAERLTTAPGGSPHVWIAGTAGSGRSSLARLLLAQHIAAGTSAVICDRTRHTHRWARLLPEGDARRGAVTYLHDIEDIHEGLIQAQERMRHGEAEVLLVDDADTAISELRALWRARGLGNGTSPALTALDNIAAVGRTYGTSLVMVTGKPISRTHVDNFGTRALLRPTGPLWRIAVGAEPPADLPRRVGAAAVVTAGGQVREGLVPWLSHAAAIDVAAGIAGLDQRLPIR